MNDVIVFTITKGEKGYNIKSIPFAKYNEYEVKAVDLYKRMSELANHFNNDLKLGILFEVE